MSETSRCDVVNANTKIYCVIQVVRHWLVGILSSASFQHSLTAFPSNANKLLAG